MLPLAVVEGEDDCFKQRLAEYGGAGEYHWNGDDIDAAEWLRGDDSTECVLDKSFSEKLASESVEFCDTSDPLCQRRESNPQNTDADIKINAGLLP